MDISDELFSSVVTTKNIEMKSNNLEPYNSGDNLGFFGILVFFVMFGILYQKISTGAKFPSILVEVPNFRLITPRIRLKVFAGTCLSMM